MEKMNSKQKQDYLDIINSGVDKHTEEDVRTNLGKHLLKLVRGFKEKGVFMKIQKVENREDEIEDDKRIINEKEFYTSKILNLKRSLDEKTLQLNMSLRKRNESRINKFINESEEMQMQLQLNSVDGILDSCCNNLTRIKSEYNKLHTI